MTWHHDIALALAVFLVVACLFGLRCEPAMFDKVQSLAMTITIATFAHAGAGVRARQKHDSDHGGPDKP